jgi:hypothetical protein
MHSRLPLVFATLAFVGHFGCSPAAPAESPQPAAESESASNEPAASEPTSGSETSSAPDPSKNPAKQEGIPDDYALSAGDCAVLAKQFATAIRNDQEAQLSPKLKDAQREQVKQNIDEVARKRQDEWRESCQKSLVGQITDPKSLKCALEARTVKDFDNCLNAQPAKQ